MNNKQWIGALLIGFGLGMSGTSAFWVSRVEASNARFARMVQLAEDWQLISKRNEATAQSCLDLLTNRGK